MDEEKWDVIQGRIPVTEVIKTHTLTVCRAGWNPRKAMKFLGKGNSSQESLGKQLTNWYLEVMFLNQNKSKNKPAGLSKPGTVVTSERSPCNLENIKLKIKAERESQEAKGTWGEHRA